MEDFCFHEMYEKWKNKDTWKYREEWIEDWKKYPREGYKEFSIDDKLDFHSGVQNAFIPTVIEYGEDHHYVFFHTDRDHFDMLLELRDHPEQFELKHIPRLLEAIDDECYELSWQKMLAEMIYGTILHYREEGLSCYLRYLPGIPRSSCFHGCELILGWLRDTEEGKELLSSALSKLNADEKTQLQEFLNDALENHTLKDTLWKIMSQSPSDMCQSAPEIQTK